MEVRILSTIAQTRGVPDGNSAKDADRDTEHERVAQCQMYLRFRNCFTCDKPRKCLVKSPDGATWRSGYATVCKTVYTSSILVVASTFYINDLELFLEGVHARVLEAGNPSGTQSRGAARP